jgi:AraC-like DNA-binding protein
MYCIDSQTSFATATPLDPRHDTIPRAPLVGDEIVWRALPRSLQPASPAPRLVATRWQSLEQCTKEVSAEAVTDYHLVKIVLRSTKFWFAINGKTVFDGVAVPGTLHVTEPNLSARCRFKGSYDTLHLHVPNDLIAECARDMPCCRTAVLSATGRVTRDLTAERLGRALLAAEQIGGSLGQLYVESIGIATVARLLALTDRDPDSDRPKVAELAKWRLNRAIEYIEAHLADPVSLADMAAASGLTRMHFAAQFRAATGLRPHEYLLRRRIERGQELLASAGLSVVEVALSVGFQTQAHFTSVFSRFIGQPPHAWRQSHAGGAGARQKASSIDEPAPSRGGHALPTPRAGARTALMSRACHKPEGDGAPDIAIDAARVVA